MVAGILGTFSTGICQTSSVVTMDWGFDRTVEIQLTVDLELNPIFAVCLTTPSFYKSNYDNCRFLWDYTELFWKQFW